MVEVDASSSRRVYIIQRLVTWSAGAPDQRGVTTVSREIDDD